MWLAVVMALTLDSVDAHSTPFDLGDDGAIVVPVLINGQGPFRFLLDTGSGQSVISARLARQFEIAPALSTIMLTPTGQRTALRATRVGALELGALRAFNVVMTVVQDGILASHQGVAGILGQDVLGQRVFTIDYRRRTIHWRGHVMSASAVTLQLERQSGQLMAVLPDAGVNGRALHLVPDTGSDGIVLFARATQALPSMTPLDVGMLRTMGSQRLIRRVLLDELRVGDLRLRHQLASLVPRSDPEGPDGDGLLPMHIFSRVTFNGPEGYLVVEP